MGTKYLTKAETATLVRESLKKQFPTVKFSVSCSRGSVVNVRWEDGPTTKAVERVAKKFEGADFDGMQDLKTYKDSTLNGERVHFGADYVFCSRTFSRALLDQVIAENHRRYRVAVGINQWGGFDVSGDMGDDHRFRELLYSAYCDNTGRVVAYVEMKYRSEAA
jgi:hypothetical protein